MANRRAWFGTVQLWQHFQYWSIDVSRTGDMVGQGVTRERQILTPGSPNFDRTIRVCCKVLGAADGSLTDDVVADLQIDDTANALIALGKSTYTLKWTDDGTNVRASIADCAFTGMSADPPELDGPYWRTVYYTFKAMGAETVSGSLSSFRNAVI